MERYDDFKIMTPDVMDKVMKEYAQQKNIDCANKNQDFAVLFYYVNSLFLHAKKCGNKKDKQNFEHIFSLAKKVCGRDECAPNCLSANILKKRKMWNVLEDCIKHLSLMLKNCHNKICDSEYFALLKIMCGLCEYLT